MTKKPINQEQIEKEQFSNEKRLENLHDNSKSENAVAYAKTATRAFEHFCISQNSTKDEEIRRHQD